MNVLMAELAVSQEGYTLFALFAQATLMVKAVMISGNFMHLRFEHQRMWWMVGVGLMITSLILFAFLVPETYHVASRSVQ